MARAAAAVLNLTLSFVNRGVLPVSIPAESHQVFVDGLLLGAGTSNSFWLAAGGTSQVVVKESISSGEFVSILRGTILSGGNIDIQLLGTATLGLGSLPFSYHSSVNLLVYLFQKAGIKIPGVAG